MALVFVVALGAFVFVAAALVATAFVAFALTALAPLLALLDLVLAFVELCLRGMVVYPFLVGREIET